MDKVIKDTFDDEEVRLFMKDKIKNDVCICKKYGKVIKRQPCPSCCDDRCQGEAPKNPKCRRTPTGNYGLTGCLQKPNLCTIMEHDVLAQVADELIHKFGIKITCKSKNKTGVTTNRRNNLESASTNNLNDSDKQCPAKSKFEKYVETGFELAETIQKTDHAESADTPLLKATDKGRMKSYGAVDERVSLKKSKETVANNNTLHSVTSERNVRESHFKVESEKSGDAYCVLSAPVQRPWQKQKPTLIPARDFLDRYLNRIENNQTLSENKVPNLRSSSFKLKHGTIKGENYGESNATDNQKIINGLCRMSINHSNNNSTDNENGNIK